MGIFIIRLYCYLKQNELTMKLTSHKKSKNIIIALALLGISFFVGFHVFSNPFSIRVPGHDSSMFQYFGYAMSRGDVLYTDIFDHKGPIIFILNFFAQYLTIGSVSGVWILEVISIFLFFVYTYKTARLFQLNRILSFIPVIIISIPLSNWLTGGNLTEEYALPFVGYSLYIFIKYLMGEKTVKSYEIVLTGISFAFVFLLRRKFQV